MNFGPRGAFPGPISAANSPAGINYYGFVFKLTTLDDVSSRHGLTYQNTWTKHLFFFI